MPLPLPVAGTLLSGFVVGLVPTVVDGLRPALRERLQISDKELDRLGRAFYLTWLPGMPLAGCVLDLGIGKDTLFYGLLAVAVGIAWIARAHRPRVALSALVFLGLAYATVATAFVQLLPSALELESRIAALNLGFVAVGLGATIGPWLLHRALASPAGWAGLLALGLPVLLPATLVGFSPEDALSSTSATLGDLYHQAEFEVLVLALLLYFAMENCLDVWPRPYLASIRPPGGVELNLAAFWGTFLLARLAMLWLSAPGYEAYLLLALAIAATCVLGNIAGAYGASSGSMGFWLVGACYGPILPSLLAFAQELPQPGLAVGILLALSGLDTILFRPMLVRYAQGQPARGVMRVFTILGIVLTAVILVLALIR